MREREKERERERKRERQMKVQIEKGPKERERNKKELNFDDYSKVQLHDLNMIKTSWIVINRPLKLNNPPRHIYAQ